MMKSNLIRFATLAVALAVLAGCGESKAEKQARIEATRLAELHELTAYRIGQDAELQAVRMSYIKRLVSTGLITKLSKVPSDKALQATVDPALWNLASLDIKGDISRTILDYYLIEDGPRYEKTRIADSRTGSTLAVYYYDSGLMLR